MNGLSTKSVTLLVAGALLLAFAPIGMGAGGTPAVDGGASITLSTDGDDTAGTTTATPTATPTPGSPDSSDSTDGTTDTSDWTGTPTATPASTSSSTPPTVATPPETTASPTTATATSTPTPTVSSPGRASTALANELEDGGASILAFLLLVSAGVMAIRRW